MPYFQRFIVIENVTNINKIYKYAKVQLDSMRVVNMTFITNSTRAIRADMRS